MVVLAAGSRLFSGRITRRGAHFMVATLLLCFCCFSTFDHCLSVPIQSQHNSSTTTTKDAPAKSSPTGLFGRGPKNRWTSLFCRDDFFWAFSLRVRRAFCPLDQFLSVGIWNSATSFSQCASFKGKLRWTGCIFLVIIPFICPIW